MNLSEPKAMTFYIAAGLAVLGLLGFLIQLPVITGLAFWLVLAGFVVLAIGVLMPNM